MNEEGWLGGLRNKIGNWFGGKQQQQPPMVIPVDEPQNPYYKPGDIDPSGGARMSPDQTWSGKNLRGDMSDEEQLRRGPAPERNPGPYYKPGDIDPSGGARLNPGQTWSSKSLQRDLTSTDQQRMRTPPGVATTANQNFSSGLSKSVNADLWRLNQAAQKYGVNHQVTQNQIASLKNQGYTAILKPDGTYTVSR